MRSKCYDDDKMVIDCLGITNEKRLGRNIFRKQRAKRLAASYISLKLGPRDHHLSLRLAIGAASSGSAITEVPTVRTLCASH